MQSRPRFLIHENKILLVMATYSKGEVVDINGPIQVMSPEGETCPEALTRKTHEMLVEALHMAKPINFKSLPNELQDQLSSSSDS